MPSLYEKIVLRSRPACLLACLGLALLVAPTLFADPELREAAQIDAEVAYAVESCRLTFEEAWEEAGEFGGLGSSVLEIGQSAPVDLSAVQDLAAARLADGLDPETRAAYLGFVESPVGQKLAWLGRELASDDWQRKLLREARKIYPRLAEERIAELETVAEATLESSTAAAIADAMTGVIDLGAAQIAGIMGEETEWDNPRSQVAERLQQATAQRAFVRLSYRLNRLDFNELGELRDWARSAPGQAYYAAFHQALGAAVAEVANAFAAEQKKRIAEEGREYAPEGDGENDEEDEEDPG